ncbi:MAG: DUF2306 domain-containing protein [Bacteroidota bacterium]
MKNKNLLLGFLFIGAISMLAMSLHFFGGEDSGILRNKVVKDTTWYRLSFFTHITFGLVAILAGPFQFIGKLIQKRPRLHKGIGYLYSLAVVAASTTGLVIAQFAIGGTVTMIGFSILSILWFGSLVIALRKIYLRDVAAHMRWMKINFALTFSAITQRTILLFAFIPYFSFMPIYQLSSWLSWTFNLTLVLVVLGKKKESKEAVLHTFQAKQ